jgi:nicotinamide riboside transporter PnuC
MIKKKDYYIFEWLGVITAIFYSVFEVIGFFLLLVSAISIGVWAYLNRHRGILLLQFFYSCAAIIGLFRWWS